MKCACFFIEQIYDYKQEDSSYHRANRLIRSFVNIIMFKINVNNHSTTILLDVYYSIP